MTMDDLFDSKNSTTKIEANTSDYTICLVFDVCY